MDITASPDSSREHTSITTLIPIPTSLPQKSEQILKIASPAMLRTWVLNKPQHPPANIQINSSILSWVEDNGGYWKLAKGSQYSHLVLTKDLDQSKAIFKLPGEIEIIYWERIKAWSVTGPSFSSETKNEEIQKKETKFSKFTNLLLVPKGDTKRTKRYAVAIYSNLDPVEDELKFESGQVMTIIKEVDNEWLECEIKGRRGLVPITYVNIDTNCNINADTTTDTPITSPKHSSTTTPTPPPNATIPIPTSNATNATNATTDTVSLTDTIPTHSQKPQIAETKISGIATIVPDSSISDNLAERSENIDRDFASPVVAKLKLEVINLQSAIDPILWHANATRDPEMREMLLDDRKTPAIAKLVRGKLSTVLAGILLQGMKQRSSLLQIDNNSLWTLVNASVKYCHTPELVDVLRASCEDVVIMSQVTNKLASPSAKFRSFICQVLNNHFLELWLRELFFVLGLSYLDYLYEPFSSYICLSDHQKLRPLIEDMLLVTQPLDTLQFKLNIKIDEEMPVVEKARGFGLSKLSGWMVKAINTPINPTTLVRTSPPMIHSQPIEKIQQPAHVSPTYTKPNTFSSTTARLSNTSVLVSAHTDVIAGHPEVLPAQTKKNSIDQLNRIATKDN